MIGVARALRKYHNSNIQVFAIEPTESAIISCHEVSDHLIEGISDGFVPGIYRRHREEVDEIVQVNSTDAVECMKMLARTYGTFVGPSSGANFLAAQRLKNNKIKNSTDNRE